MFALAYCVSSHTEAVDPSLPVLSIPVCVVQTRLSTGRRDNAVNVVLVSVVNIAVLLQI